MVSNLYKKTNYLINARFIKSVNITEYDISKANISILFSKGLISQNEYEYLYRLPKYDREITIGLMIRDNKGIYDAIKDGIINSKRLLFEKNNIKDIEVIRVANDAVYVMRNLPLQYTKFGLVEFLPKHRYSTFARLGDLTVFFGSKLGELEIDVVGLGEEQIPLHADYMISFIGNLFYMIESNTISAALEFFLNFYRSYLDRKLDIGFYREFNSMSMFVITSSNGSRYGIMSTDNINQIDISYNAGILRELYGMICEVHQRDI